MAPAMTTPSDIAGRFWNLPQKPGEETARELSFIDDIIQKAHLERLILENLSGVRTVFGGGAGYGRFSIMLAKLGLKVTHFDISEGMIAKARELAAAEGVAANITFALGSIDELGAFSDGQFDLALCFDAPISFCYPGHEAALAGLMRIAAKRICVSVFSRLGSATYLWDPTQKQKYILDKSSDSPLVQWYMERESIMREGFAPDVAAAYEYMRTGLFEKTEATISSYEKGESPWPISYAFMPEELISILRRYGATNIRLSGPGALSRAVPGEVLAGIIKNEKLRKEFLDFCYVYDSNPYCAGMGKDNLVAIADLDR